MSGNLRVRVASAGTGKTTVLVARYLELIGSGVPLRRIAGATFTRAAATELRQRVAEGMDSLFAEGDFLGLVTLRAGQEERFAEARRELPGALLTTISGLMIRFLRLTAPQAGLDPEFSVIDETEAELTFEEELLSLALTGDRSFDEDERERALALFRSRSLSPSFRAADSAAENLLTVYARAWNAYRLRLGTAVLGPADVEIRALELTEQPLLLRRLRSRYSHVLLDEYQDVNPVQGRFFRALVGAGLEVEAVGDPKQSIYAFRDADVDVFRAALAEGTRLPDLQETRRHTPEITTFLNHLTAGTAGGKAGFSAGEAPAVRSAGTQAARQGGVAVHWLSDSAATDALRNQEARLLARLLHEQQRAGYAWEDMAVIAPAHASLETARRALSEAGIPSTFGSGRGFFSRPEIIDVTNALAAGISASGPEFAAWLRSPFVQLSMEETQQVLLAADRRAALAALDPRHAGSLDRLGELVMLAPLEALKGVLREPLACGRPYSDWLGGRQRANLDALLQRTAARQPADLELLLNDLKRQRRATTAEVPEAGGGVELVTVHYAKGLEWRVAALFDSGRGLPPVSPPLLVRRSDGTVALPGTALYEALLEDEKERLRQEHVRRLYVAASRPQDRLLVTGSKGGGYAPLLRGLGLLPETETVDMPLPGVELHRHALDREEASPLPDPRAEVPVRPAAPWTETVFSPGLRPAVASPSALNLPAAGAQETPGEQTAASPDGGLARSSAAAAGTLLHSAIAWDWQPADEGFRENLLAQEVMFPFTEGERHEIVARVTRYLETYRGMLGRELPDLAERERDEAELPVILPYAGTVWRGIIDRLYLAGGAWYLDDYKTDATMEAEAHHGQLALYALAVSRALQVEPRVRLVWLRHGRVTEVAQAELAAALARVTDGAA